jgi:GrpB-like predicted nucleotidyltransferase (UPF0157 family)
LFDEVVLKVSNLFGEPASKCSLERARFVTGVDGKHVDVFVINKECDGWKNGVKFEDYLKSHPESLEEYRILKENGDGVSTREYYRTKIGFINEILAQK